LHHEIAQFLASQVSLLLPSDAALADLRQDPLIAQTEQRGILLDDTDSFNDVPEGLFEPAQLLAMERLHAPDREAREFKIADNNTLAHHVINLAGGELSQITGQSTPPEEQIQNLFRHLDRELAKQPSKAILLYAHGGLVSEENGLDYARAHIHYWLKNDVFPIFFVWESGFLEVFKQRLDRERGFSDFTDGLLELLVGPIGKRAWREMKASCQRAFMPSLEEGGIGGGYRALEYLRDVLKNRTAKLHLVGHSAGSILMAELLDRWLSHEEMRIVPAEQNLIESLQLMAPAIRRDRFHELVFPHLQSARLKQMVTYTMDDQRERADDCGHVYRKSLLYLVSRACEGDDEDSPIFGMQRYLDGKERDAGLLAQWHALNHSTSNRFEVHYSSDRNDSKSITRAEHHGDFDNDPYTIRSVLKVVNSGSGEQDYCEHVKSSLCDPREKRPIRAYVKRSFEDRAESMSQARGRKIQALVVGIDNYNDPRIRNLSGCIADARAWQSALKNLGAQVTLLLDDVATQAAVHAWLKNHIRNAGEGDVLVFCFAGHGTRRPGTQGEADGQDDFLVLSPRSTNYLLSDNLIRAELQGLAAGASCYLIMDCCHSGTLLELGDGSRARFADLPARDFAEEANRPPLRSGAGPAVLFAACKEDQTAREVAGRGLFSAAALRDFEQAVLQGTACKTWLGRVIARVQGQTPALQVYDLKDSDLPVLGQAKSRNDAFIKIRG
jgi:hypothetical protein